MVPPDRLLNAASPQLRAFQARAPLLTPQQRLDSALIAAGLGVFSSQSLVDLYSAIYDSTDPSDLPGHRRLAVAPGVRRQGRDDPAGARSASCSAIGKDRLAEGGDARRWSLGRRR